MARTCHSEGMRERQRMRNHDPSGKYDLGYRDSNGHWQHICRYSDEEAARAAEERLANPSDEEQSLLGLPESPDTEIIER